MCRFLTKKHDTEIASLGRHRNKTLKKAANISVGLCGCCYIKVLLAIVFM